MLHKMQKEAAADATKMELKWKEKQEIFLNLSISVASI